jgi:hypothetical protein
LLPIDLHSLADRAPNPHQLLQECEQIRLELAELDRLGLTDASPTWKDDRYLVLAYPQVNGQRRREYVGNDPARVKRALTRVRRSRRHRRLQHKLTHLERQLGQALEHLERCNAILDW